MEIIKTKIDGLMILQPTVYKDERGYFMESFKASFFEEHFSDIKFIQDNESRSSYGVLRGLHFQKAPYEQTKLVRVVHGEVLDVAVDLRPNSPTFGKHEAVKLSSENKKQLLIPKGFAHGFVTLSEEAVFSYKVDNIYASEFDSGIVYNDKTISIDWKMGEQDVKLSEKDLSLRPFSIVKNELLGV
jgi:dTDP-4-dehydrorhamnose 3,5-epimerase